MTVIAIQFVAPAMLRVTEVELEGSCKDAGSRVLSRCMADIARGEIASLRRRSGVTLEAGRVSARSARYREGYAPAGRFMAGNTRSIRMPGVIKSGAEALQAGERLEVRALRFLSRMANGA